MGILSKEMDLCSACWREQCIASTEGEAPAGLPAGRRRYFVLGRAYLPGFFSEARASAKN
jgi:hypothetical protein